MRFPYAEHNDLLDIITVLDKRFPEIVSRKSPVLIRSQYGNLRVNREDDFTVTVSQERGWGVPSLFLTLVSNGSSAMEFADAFLSSENFLIAASSAAVVNTRSEDEYGVARDFIYKFDTEQYLHEEEFNFLLDIEIDHEFDKDIIRMVADVKRSKLENVNYIIVDCNKVEFENISFEHVIKSMNRSPFFWKNFE